MKLPVVWLKDYVDFEDSVENLAEKLTFSGIEVEGIETVGAEFDGVVAGEVRDVRKHPNADKLSLCSVFDGTAEYAVVCGAPNVKTGGMYPFAPVGVTLPDGMKLKKAKIRGEVSHGMLLAEDELGLSDDHTGLLELPVTTQTGTPLVQLLGGPETVLDLEITPNRPDCLSILGIAREVSALYGIPLKYPDINLQESGTPAAELTRVDIKDTERCPRYTARMLHQIKIKPSPDWMQKRLKLAGVRPINNMVDITNFVMIESGQPLHAFDQTLLGEGRIVVRRARPDECMTTLDDVERRLTPEMLVIADADRAVALAGIMGGADSEIKDTTETVLLESACFAPDPIRMTSRTLGLSSESSYRFERGTDVNTAEWASRRAAALAVKLADARCAPGVVDAYPQPVTPWTVTCRREKTGQLLGISVDIPSMTRIFESLELNIIEADDRSCTVEIPTFRGDLEREVDLIEEYARIHGLDQIPSPSPRSIVVPDAEDRHTRAVFACRNTLIGLGLTEIMNYSLLSDKGLNHFMQSDIPRRIVLPHPISEDQSVLRTSLIPQMVETLGHNRARQLKQAGFFEMGRVFEKHSDGSTSEEERISLGMMGPIGRDSMSWQTPVKAEEAFIWLKGLVESLLQAQRIPQWEMSPCETEYLRKGFALELSIAKEPAGLFGIVRPEIAEEWRFQEPVAVAELALNPLVQHIFDVPSIHDIPAYPPVERDMALIVDQHTQHEEIMNIIRAHAPPELEDIRLFDIFTGKSIGTGKKSMAYALSYRSSNRTLTDEETNRYHNGVKGALQKTLDIQIREN